jgi:hypothetical protein
MKLMSNSKANRHQPRSVKLAALIRTDHQELLARIPRGLLLQVNALKPVLRLNGSVQERRETGRRRTYRLRYRDPNTEDGTFQKAIPVPEEAVPGVEQMLIGFQCERAQEDERKRARRRTEELWRKLEEGEDLGSVPGF